MLKYTVTVVQDRLVKDQDGVTVFLYQRGSGQGQGMPMGKFPAANLEQAATVATFLQDALHNQYVAGLKQGYDNAIALLNGPSSEGVSGK